MDGVDFDLGAGEAAALVGESGCGKTMIARALVGLPPDRARVTGSIRLRGRELVGAAEAEWRRVRGGDVALVFQQPASAFDPVKTIGSQIVEAARAHRDDLDRRAAEQLAMERLREVGFPDPRRGMGEYAHRLSGGLAQRAFLAVALASDPAVLVADEPTSALDATVAADVLDLFDRLRARRGLTLLLITHDLSSVVRHAERVFVMSAGRIVEQGATSNLFAAPRHEYTRALLAARPMMMARNTALGTRNWGQ